ncbi:hypothetical protein AGMMS49579_12780 [Spirochaetia bacterium]|nr:hypothetical protein AGMMS49579_12780 [Spirochaetia bacterium]
MGTETRKKKKKERKKGGGEKGRGGESVEEKKVGRGEVSGGKGERGRGEDIIAYTVSNYAHSFPSIISKSKYQEMMLKQLYL